MLTASLPAGYGQHKIPESSQLGIGPKIPLPLDKLMEDRTACDMGGSVTVVQKNLNTLVDGPGEAGQQFLDPMIIGGQQLVRKLEVSCGMLMPQEICSDKGGTCQSRKNWANPGGSFLGMGAAVNRSLHDGRCIGAGVVAVFTRMMLGRNLPRNGDHNACISEEQWAVALLGSGISPLVLDAPGGGYSSNSQACPIRGPIWEHVLASLDSMVVSAGAGAVLLSTKVRTTVTMQVTPWGTGGSQNGPRHEVSLLTQLPVRVMWVLPDSVSLALETEHDLSVGTLLLGMLNESSKWALMFMEAGRTLEIAVRSVIDKQVPRNTPCERESEIFAAARQW
jgi:hypothetical protein